MKKIFTYWDNSKQYHGKKLFQVGAETIAEADELFILTCKKIPFQNPTISVNVDFDNAEGVSQCFSSTNGER
jgi:hypothetical protein